MLNFNGDTAVYLLYSHARIASILRKAEKAKGVSLDTHTEQSSLQAPPPPPTPSPRHQLLSFAQKSQKILVYVMHDQEPSIVL